MTGGEQARQLASKRKGRAATIAQPMRSAFTLEKSEENYIRATDVLPGGTTRVTVKRMPVPIYMQRGEGAFMVDVDGNRYLDLIGNYTALVHGHAFRPVTEALSAQLAKGTCFANPTEWEIALAEILVERVPVVKKVRFANSGTEAVMFAIKAARAFTGRTRIAKLEGAYHGAYDWAEVSEASTPENWGGREPNSTPYYVGMPKSVLEETVVLPLNDIAATTALIERHATDLACVLIDIMPSRAGLILLEPDYLAALTALAHKHQILIVSDEVLNFRCGYNGISARFLLQPDVVTFGKIIGGGLPIGAFGGREDVMDVFNSAKGSPMVPHGGTFAANPLSMIAGVMSMRHLTPEIFAHLERLGERARAGLRDIAAKRQLAMSITGAGSLFRIHLRPEPPRTYREAWVTPNAGRLHKQISDHLLPHGVMIPSDTSACCSGPMTLADVDKFLRSFETVLDEIPDSRERLNAIAADRPHEAAVAPQQAMA